METMKDNDPIVVSVTRMIRVGDVEALRRILDENPMLASARIVNDKGELSTFLHAVTDWPGYFPNGPMIVKMLVDAGADPNAPITGSWHSETPLHWAASSDDVDVAEALIDAGADIGVLGGSIAEGTLLDNAVGYGCWNVARLLVAQGARVDKLWHAAALGLMSRVEELLSSDSSSIPDEINYAFWQASHGGQRRVAELLLSKGADINWTPNYTNQTSLDTAASLDTRRDTMITWLKTKGANSSGL
ncbi:hypothetical protein CJP46_25175 [Paenibacillus sp. XY044]|nr:hypothetical protein CJP46_25175 [Paenibacillus sp. XY044]